MCCGAVFLKITYSLVFYVGYRLYIDSTCMRAETWVANLSFGKKNIGHVAANKIVYATRLDRECKHQKIFCSTVATENNFKNAPGEKTRIAPCGVGIEIYFATHNHIIMPNFLRYARALLGVWWLRVECAYNPTKELHPAHTTRRLTPTRQALPQATILASPSPTLDYTTAPARRRYPAYLSWNLY